MPFVAYFGDRRVDATAMTPAAWAAMQADPARRRLVLPECGTRAVAKTSGLGTRFFAHHREADCTAAHRAETAVHRALKEALARRIDRTSGWRAVVEYTEDRSWITDVMAIPRTGMRIAFEVQLSGQSQAEYALRTQRYFDAGIGPVWLVPKLPYEADLFVPLVELGVTKSTPVPEDPSELLWAHRTFQPLVASHLSPGQVLDRILAGRFTWKHGSPRDQEPEIARRRLAREEAKRREQELKLEKEADKERKAKEDMDFFRALVDDAMRRGRHQPRA